MVSNIINFNLWNLVIRPPRALYTNELLGPAAFCWDTGGEGRRREIELETSRGLRLCCSHFVPVIKGLKQFPVVIYLHGNTSNRLEAWDLVVPLLKRGISLFCFDAAGCGLSEGEYISLGWFERHDLAEIIAYLRQSPSCGPIALWGWSMGAATALLYADCDPLLKAICVDSPFTSLRQVIEHMATSGSQTVVPLPSWLIDPAIAVIRMRVQALANFDIEDITPVEHAKLTYVPALFVTRKEDMFVPPQHSTQLIEAYAGPTEQCLVDGDHNCNRSSEDIETCIQFLCEAFDIDPVAIVMPSRTLSEEMPVPDEHDKAHPRYTSPPKITRALAKELRQGALLDCLDAGLAVPSESERLDPLASLPACIGFPEPRPLPPVALEPQRALPLFSSRSVTARPDLKVGSGSYHSPIGHFLSVDL